MKKSAYLLLALCLIGCAHVNPNPPTEKFCRLERLTANPQPCVPYVCYGYRGCAGEIAWVLLPLAM